MYYEKEYLKDGSLIIKIDPLQLSIMGISPDDFTDRRLQGTIQKLIVALMEENIFKPAQAGIPIGLKFGPEGVELAFPPGTYTDIKPEDIAIATPDDGLFPQGIKSQGQNPAEHDSDKKEGNPEASMLLSAISELSKLFADAARDGIGTEMFREMLSMMGSSVIGHPFPTERDTSGIKDPAAETDIEDDEESWEDEEECTGDCENCHGCDDYEDCEDDEDVEDSEDTGKHTSCSDTYIPGSPAGIVHEKITHDGKAVFRLKCTCLDEAIEACRGASVMGNAITESLLAKNAEGYALYIATSAKDYERVRSTLMEFSCADDLSWQAYRQGLAFSGAREHSEVICEDAVKKLAKL